MEAGNGVETSPCRLESIVHCHCSSAAFGVLVASLRRRSSANGCMSVDVLAEEASHRFTHRASTIWLSLVQVRSIDDPARPARVVCRAAVITGKMAATFHHRSAMRW